MMTKQVLNERIILQSLSQIYYESSSDLCAPSVFFYRILSVASHLHQAQSKLVLLSQLNSHLPHFAISSVISGLDPKHPSLLACSLSQDYQMNLCNKLMAHIIPCYKGCHSSLISVKFKLFTSSLTTARKCLSLGARCTV